MIIVRAAEALVSVRNERRNESALLHPKALPKPNEWLRRSTCLLVNNVTLSVLTHQRIENVLRVLFRLNLSVRFYTS